MPLYDYHCQQCDTTFEELVQGAKAAVVCPKCQTANVERLLSVPARPRSEAMSLPMNCQSEGPPCGAPWCKRT